MSLKKANLFWAIPLVGICVTLILDGLADLSRAAPISSVYSGYLGNMPTPYPVAIPSASPTSAAIALKGFVPVGIYMPAAFTGATISFTASDALAGTYEVLKSTTSGTTLSYTVTQGTYVALDPAPFQGVSFLKIISASSEAGARTLKVSLKGL